MKIANWGALALSVVALTAAPAVAWEPSKPGFSRNCRRTSSTIEAAARPTAVMVMPPNR